MKVAIINTPAKGTEVHGHNCADIAKSEKRNKDDAWYLEVDSKLEVSHIYWNDQIGDQVDPESAEGWNIAASWINEFNFLPCTKGLEDGQSPFATDEDETTEAPAAMQDLTVTTWVGKAIATIAIEQGTLVEKFQAAKPTKAGDRTIKLTADEATVLRALATALEANGGSIAYSARTLRARLS